MIKIRWNEVEQVMVDGNGQSAARWFGRDFPAIDALSFDLTPAHLAALDALMDRLRPTFLPFHAIKKSDFDHPALTPDLAALARLVKHGRGIVFIRGFPVHRYDIADLEKMFWGVGTHFGQGHSQSAAGDLMGHVVDRTRQLQGKQSGRGYLSSRMLSPHTDMTEILAMLSVRKSAIGGESVFASALTIYDIVKAEHPEYIAIYERGFPYHRRGEAAPDAAPITPYNVPLYSTRDGLLSCFHVRDIIDVAMRDLGREYTDLERAALDFFEEVFARDEVKIEMMMEPGDAVFLNNYEVLHGRRNFVNGDDPAENRFIFRLQMETTPMRPLADEVFIYENRIHRHGIDPQAGKTAAAPEFLVANAS